MNSKVLKAECDPMGSAIAEYSANGKAARLRVFSSQFEEDEIPVKELFRGLKQMSTLEQTALTIASGKILDVGAGSGCHSLVLQQDGKDVTAIDISPLSVETMKQRGVNNVELVDLFDDALTEQYDTILMLMNGSGIIGRLDNMKSFFSRMKQLLKPNGQILMDSSDLRYLFENEDGSFDINLAGAYYGQIDFQMQYRDVKGEPFDWLYVDFATLSMYASENGFEVKMIREGKHYDYLASLRIVG